MANTIKEIKDQNDINYFISLKEEDITKSFIMKNFGNFNNKPKFSTSDVITIPPNIYGKEGKKNKNSFRTTLGLWVFNKLFIEKDLFDLIGYVNHEITGDDLNDINTMLSYSILEDGITIDSLKKYLMKQQFMMRFVSVLSPNHTMKMLKSSQYLSRYRDQLIKENIDEIKKGNETVSAQIEKKLLDEAQNYLKDDPSMDMYNSKARGKFSNNFKNMFIMKGATANPNPEKGFDIATSNYIDGIKKEEFVLFSNAMITGPYSRAKNTAVGGYWVKLFLSAFQHLTLDPAGSDCKTDKYITVTLTKKNIKDYMYCYVIEGSNLVEITSKNSSKYIDKTVKMRFSTKCESKTGFCNKCAGNLYYRLGIKNIGMTTPKIPSRVMNISLKKFHDGNVRIADMDIEKIF